MKTLIIYTSKHNGNTKKITETIGAELGAETVNVSDLNDFDADRYDLVGLGSGIYGGKHDASIIDLVGKLKNAKNKRFFIFSTSGFKESEKNDFNKPLKESIESAGGKIVSSFSCPGFGSLGPLKFLGINKGRPNGEDVEKAKEFARSLKPKVMTLCLALKEGKVLLGMKKRGFGEGRWNGFGGKVHEGESILEGAKREMLEESGLSVSGLEERGRIDFHFMDSGKLMEVHIFEVLGYEGEPVETEEMRPQWFRIDDIPFKNMWADDPYWFPLFLEKKRFKGRIIFKDNDEIIDSKLDVLD
ncbi:MAG: NUDIX domain-containing protein [Candidatus Paceibacterota bacterium]